MRCGTKMGLSTAGGSAWFASGRITLGEGRLSSDQLVVLSSLRGFRVAPVSLEEMWNLISTRLLIEREALRQAIAKGGDFWEATIVAAFHALRLSSEQVNSDPAGPRRVGASAPRLPRHPDCRMPLAVATEDRRQTLRAVRAISSVDPVSRQRFRQGRHGRARSHYGGYDWPPTRRSNEGSHRSLRKNRPHHRSRAFKNGGRMRTAGAQRRDG
jgi:hypothetical protein